MLAMLKITYKGFVIQEVLINNKNRICITAVLVEYNQRVVCFSDSSFRGYNISKTYCIENYWRNRTQ